MVGWVSGLTTASFVPSISLCPPPSTLLFYFFPKLNFPWKLSATGDASAKIEQNHSWRSISASSALPLQGSNIGGSVKVPGGFHDTRWLTKWCARLAAVCGGAERGGSQKQQWAFNCFNKGGEEESFHRNKWLEDWCMMWHFQLLFPADTRSDTDKWSAYDSLLIQMQNAQDLCEITFSYCHILRGKTKKPCVE